MLAVFTLKYHISQINKQNMMTTYKELLETSIKSKKHIYSIYIYNPVTMPSISRKNCKNARKQKPK